MYDIRLATIDDIDDILVHCEQFHINSPASVLEFSKERTRDVIKYYLESPKETHIVGLLTFNEKPIGLIAGQAVQALSSDSWMALETMWWVEKEHRSRYSLFLFDLFEQWASKTGCAVVVMSGVHKDGKDPVVDKYYIRNGYSRAETTYMKEI